MKIQSQSLAMRFREVMLDGRWIANTNVKEQLSDLNWTQATTKVDTLNTIAVLTFHLSYYIAGVLKVLEGGPLEIRDKFSFDAPELESEKDWKALKEKLFKDSEQFAKRIEAMSDKDLQKVFVDENYGNYQRNLDGMIEHCYYHFGQIVVLKKMVLS